MRGCERRHLWDTIMSSRPSRITYYMSGQALYRPQSGSIIVGLMANTHSPRDYYRGFVEKLAADAVPSSHMRHVCLFPRSINVTPSSQLRGLTWQP
jgi:hypothetical protein